MSVITNNLLLGEDGYNISRSVRLRSSASAYFSRTPASAGNRQTSTLSFWLKRGALGTSQLVFDCGEVSTPVVTRVSFTSSDTIRIENLNSSRNIDLITSQVFRDPSAWYHFVVAFDTTQATSSNRVKLYVNGVQVTSFSTNSITIAQNGTLAFNSTSYPFNIGRNVNNAEYTDGYLTEVNFIDGQALTPSSFGETDAVTGVWKPKSYAGTYGTNGFYLNFADNSNNTAATIGKDSSGNGNNWTPNNISVTAGVTYDSMLDTPTPYADGGNGRGNYCVFNPLVGTHSNTYSNGNLQVATSTANAAFSHQRATFGLASGKWYWEITCQATSSAYYIVGITADTVNPDSQYIGQGNSYCYRNDTGQKGNNGTFSSYGATFTTGDIIGVEFDADAGTLVFYKNGTSQGTAFTGISGTYFPAVADLDNNTSRNSTFIANFGQRPFAYTPPTGFKALNTQNLPDATIKKGSDYMGVLLYTGDGTTSKSVTGLNFQPDMVYVKNRSAASDPTFSDVVRGITKVLYSDSTAGESTAPSFGYINSVSSTGINVNSGGGTEANFNKNSQAYVAWNWKESASAGFDIVTYTGNGTAGRTVAHSLGVAPKMVIVKPRSASGDDNWKVYHASIGGTGALLLNSTSATSTSSVYWNNTSPTSSVFTVGSSASANYTNQNAIGYIAYLFSEVAGFSKFGSYTGNGSSDGTFVYCGFRPRFIMIKRTDTTSNWVMWDTARDTYNAGGLGLYPNLSAAEDDYRSSNPDDILSNGFKPRANYANVNASGGTYIFMAVAENPFKNSLAR